MTSRHLSPLGYRVALCVILAVAPAGLLAENRVTVEQDLNSAAVDTVDEIVLAARPLAASADIEASLNWRELQ